VLTRPNALFSEIGTQAIERGLADPILSAFFENIMSAQRGDVQQGLKPYLPYLSLCSDKMPDGTPPPIFYVGRDSGQRTLFGEDWATPSSPSAGLRTPDPDLERASAEGYGKALEGTPYYGYARTEVHVNGETFEVAFERLIVAVRPTVQSSVRFCAYFGVIQDLRRTS